MSQFKKTLFGLAGLFAGVMLLGASSALAQVAFTTSSSSEQVRGEGTTEYVGAIVLSVPTAGSAVAGEDITLNYSAPVTEYTAAGVTCTGTCGGYPGNYSVTVTGNALSIAFTGPVTFAAGDFIAVDQIRVNASAVATTGTTNITVTPTSVSTAGAPITFTNASAFTVGVATLPSTSVSISTTSTTPTPIGVPLSVLTCNPANNLANGTVNFSFQIKEDIPDAWTTKVDENSYTPGEPTPNGSWISVTFNNVPAGYTVEASSQTSKTGNTAMGLVSAGSTVAAPGATPLGAVIGTATAAVAQTTAGTPVVFTYYFGADVLNDPDTATLGFFIEVTPTATTATPVPASIPITATVAYAPLWPSPAPKVNVGSIVSFASGNEIGSLTVANISDCITRLLFPWVLGGNSGYDTGIAIANTSLDAPAFTAPNNALPQNGTCTLTGYPGTTSGFANGSNAGTPISATSGTIAAGSTTAFDLSSVAGFNDFDGSMLGVCNFLNAHVFTFITNGYGSLTGPDLAEGYNALIVPNAPRTGAFGEALGQ